MRPITFCIVFLSFLLGAPWIRAQDHGEVGVYGDYFHLNGSDTGFGGLGGRLSVNVSQRFQLEGELNYDFTRVFTEGFRNPTNGSVVIQRSGLRLLHGLFGPKLLTGAGPVRLFVTVKGGFLDFRFDNRPANLETFTSTVEDLRLNNVKGALYPGAGMEVYVGPLGIRVEVGDEMYFANGTHHDIRVSIGPNIRF